MEKIIKPITEITRDEWILYQWQDITTYSDSVRMLLRGHFRTPDEGAKAAGDWDIWIRSSSNRKIDL